MASKRILDVRGKPITHKNGAASTSKSWQEQRVINARYDAAQRTHETNTHWSEADPLSAKAANSPQVRFMLRNRARYECANSSYLRGIVDTLANDTIGTGPRLQLLTPDSETNRVLEAEFNHWSLCSGLGQKLLTMRKARCEDGESFAVLTTNPKLDSPVKVDLRLYEADQVASPFFSIMDPNNVDGIRYDRFGNPTEYDFLKVHPGDLINTMPFEFDTLPAEIVCHFFKADRPGQRRGIPDVTAALPLVSQLRRYTLAVLSAAELAANLAGIIYSDLPPGEDATDCVPFEQIQIPRSTMTTLPAGWRMGQFQANQPVTTYTEFKNAILNEIARCLNMPFNVAAGNSSGYNYSSGRLDHQVYYKSLKVDQSHLERVVLDPALDAWLVEAALTRELGRLVRPIVVKRIPHNWMFDGPEHVDPEKEANAQGTRLKNRTTSYSREFARQGRDWEKEFIQIATEQKRMKELGITPEVTAPTPPVPGKPVTKKPKPGEPLPDEDPPEEEEDDGDLAED